MKHPRYRSFAETVNAFRRVDYHWLGWTIPIMIWRGWGIIIVRFTEPKPYKAGRS